ncbi:hypothetical protein [Methylobacterium hispanicum]|uniref:hypothetical protein n=1 Tax=Methylobacterium hispanicum TaxID=270350 RepID=UPI002F2EA116
MLRVFVVPSALLFLVAAAPAQRQPTPATIQGDAPDIPHSTERSMQRMLKMQEDGQAKVDARNKAWDTKLKKSMGGVCSGC